MNQRIPEGAFGFYVGLGAKRSYQAVAEKFGVTKRAVLKHATKERWTERLEDIEEEARAESDKKLATDLAEMHERHKRVSRKSSRARHRRRNRSRSMRGMTRLWGTPSGVSSTARQRTHHGYL